MTTPTPIATFEDILAAMENNPRLQAAMRQHVLDQEFLQLPAIVRELQQAVAQLAQLVHDYIAATDARLEQIEARLDRIEDDVAELKAGQVRLEGRFDHLEGRFDRMEGRFDRLEGQFNQFRGENYEIRVQSQVVSYSIIQMGFSNPYVSRPVNAGNAPQFNSVLQQALSNDAITRDQAMDLCNADLIISADDNQHIVAEISIAASATDIERAARRASIMESATDGACTPAIIAQDVPAPQAAHAAANKVAVMLFT